MRFRRQQIPRAERRCSAAGGNPKWVFALSGVGDNQIAAYGLFTADNPHLFFSRRAISSFRGKLFSIRDRVAAGRQIESITLMPPGCDAPIQLSLDNLEAQFRERVPFKRRMLYLACLVSPVTEPME